MLKADVLRKDEDFRSIYKKGKSVAGKYLVVFYRKNGLSFNRRAFLASKKVGNSVQRNRARRLMKESYRQLESRLPQGWDLIFIARRNILPAKCGDVEKNMIGLMKKTGLLA